MCDHRNLVPSPILENMVDEPQTKSRHHKIKLGSSKALARKLTPTEIDTAKHRLMESLKSAFSSEDIMEKLWKEYIPVVRTGDARKLVRTKEHIDLFRQALTIYGLDNHVPLSETVERQYWPLVSEFSNQLIKDYSCRTSGEKALAETIASAYIRILVISRRLNGALTPETVKISREHTTFYSMLSKELDRANRHFTSAFQMLVRLKQPPLNVHLKTQNAYVAQAQQFNMGKPEPKENEKIINPI